MFARLKSRLQDFEQFVADVIFDRRDDRPAQVFASGLKVLAVGYEAVMRLRQWLYRKRILHDHALGCLVVVVGNLTVGGTGKTPVVEKFARALRDRGRRVAILSRGYKSRREPLLRRAWRRLTHGGGPPPPRVVSDGDEVLLDSAQAGDEPFMLARNLPGVVVLVDKDRVKAGAYAIRRFGCDTLILDDGFQYLRLRGALNLLLIDKCNPFGNESLLPRGILREPVEHLRRASYVFLTKSDGSPDLELREAIRQHHPEVEIIECAHRLKHLVPWPGGEPIPLEQLRGRRVAAFSGIATPETFESMLEDLGAVLVARRRFLDHHRFDAEDLGGIAAAAHAAGAAWIVTTEKDAVRLPAGFAPEFPLYYLRLEIEILSGVANFEEAVERICFYRTLPPGNGG